MAAAGAQESVVSMMATAPRIMITAIAIREISLSRATLLRSIRAALVFKADDDREDPTIDVDEVREK